MSPKPRKLPARTITRWSRETVGNLSWVEAHCAELVKANEWMDDGRKGVDYSAVRRGGSEGSAPELAALAGRTDDVGRAASRFMTLLEGVRRDSYELRKWANLLRGADYSDDEVRKAAEFLAAQSNAAGTSSAPCKTCKRTVAGTPNDRLRAGECPECYGYRHAHYGNPRPANLWDGQCTARNTRPGVGEFECVLPLSHVKEGSAHDFQRIEGAA